jgi:hypothetical protein
MTCVWGFDHGNSCPGPPITNKGGMGHERRKKGTEGSGSVSGQPNTDCIAGTADPDITYDIGINACKAAEEALRKNEVEAVNENLKTCSGGSPRTDDHA